LKSSALKDKDRKLSEHDAACRYLAYVAAEQVWWALFPKDVEEVKKCLAGIAANEPEYARAYVIRGQTEIHVSKGSGQYQQTVGFVDVLMSGWTGHKHSDGKFYVHGTKAVIEVKVNPSQTTDAIRQLRLYGSFVDQCDRLVLATLYEIPGTGRLQLAREGIRHLQLGPAFRQWLETDQGADGAPKPVVV
jgi:hypothetical protein